MAEEMTLLDKCKLALRISVNDYDDEVRGLINSAKRDMSVTGIVDTDDAMYTDAIICFVKANFGFDNPDREGLLERYNRLLNKMSMLDVYTTPTPPNESGE